MVLEISEVDDLTSSLSPAHNNNVAAADGSLVGADVSAAPVTDVVPIQIVSPADNKVEVTKGGVESLNFGVPDDGGDVNVEDDEEPNAGEDNDGSDDEDEDEYDVDDDDDDDDEEEEYDEEDVYRDDVMVEDDEDGMDKDGGIENKVDGSDENKKGERTVGGESVEKENEDKGGVSLEPKIEKLKKKKVIKKVAVRKDLDKVIVQNKDKLEGDEKNDPADGEKGNRKEEVEEKGGGSLKKNVKGSRKGDRKKVISESSEKATTKPNSKLKKKGGSSRAESMGMIFMCSSKTKQDCYRYHVLGLPAGKRNIVEKIYKGMRLFLYDVDLKLLYGIYKAAGRGSYNIEPKAFNSKFPSQVRFTVLEDCVPLAEEKFRKVIKDNYFAKNKFDCQLKHEQVKNLCKLFLAASKGFKSKRLDRSHKAKVQASMNLDRSRTQGVDERRRSGLDENHRHHDYFHVRQREVIMPPVARVSQVAPLPPPIDAPRYGYDGALERDAYRQNILLEHRGPYRQPLLASRDAYRRQPLSEYRDVYRQEPVLDRYDGYRREEVLEHRDLRPINLPVRHRDEIARDDPYGFYRERQSYRDAVYIEHLPSEPDRYNSAPTEYRSRAAPISDYRSTRALYRY